MAQLTQAQINNLLASPDFTLVSKASYEGRVFKLYCKQYENGAEANTSTIHWMTRSEGGVVKWYNTGPTTVGIGGVKVLNAYPRQGVNNNFPSGRNTYTSGSFIVNHKDSGAIDPLSVYITTAIYWGDWNLQTTDPVSWQLRKINRYFSRPIEHSTSNLTETGCTITIKTSEPMSRATIKEDNGKTFSSSIVYSSDRKNATITITNLKPGTKYNFTVTSTRSDSGMSSSIRVTPTTYDYPYVVKNNNSTLYPGDSVTLTIYNPLKRDIKIYMSLVDKNIDDSAVITNTSSYSAIQGETTITTTAEMIYNSLPASVSANVYYFCQTSDLKFSEKTNKGRISIFINENELPNLTSGFRCLVWEAYSPVANITGQGTPADTVWLVQGLSTLGIKIDRPARGYYTSIVSYNLKIGHKEVTIPASDISSSTISWSELNLVGEQSLEITVTDARGLKNTTTKKIIFYPYKKPSASIKAVRVNNYGTNVTINFGWSCSNVNSTNKFKLYYTIDQNGSSITNYIYGSSTNFISSSSESGSGTKSLTNISNEKGAIFTIFIQDLFGEPIEVESSRIERGQPIFFIDEEQSGVGVNCFPKGTGVWSNEFHFSPQVHMILEENSIKFKFNN